MRLRRRTGVRSGLCRWRAKASRWCEWEVQCVCDAAFPCLAGEAELAARLFSEESAIYSRSCAIDRRQPCASRSQGPADFFDAFIVSISRISAAAPQMNRPLWISTLLLMGDLLLAACGGGGNSEPPAVQAETPDTQPIFPASEWASATPAE